MKAAPALFLILALAACGRGSGSQVPGDSADTAPFSGIAEDEVLQLTGTEPFWGGKVSAGTFTYTTPQNAEGSAIAVERFAGRGGLSFGGELAGTAVDLLVTPAECSDGMSDRTFPFTVTLMIGAELRRGCAWSDAHPFTGSKAP